ncbi:hypothetical protein Q4491_09460 [Photobacterium sp. 2_MG-2023]|uniref:hypothetical protein n=1 Tax=Photobacterium TaxID=657 RepID=UPI0026E48CA0|nr:MULTISPECIES: hypothetical protein [Photobacterium]MDO6581572.1 hypothetical protein [Photobacterium sp. 2_MG-2023]
MTPQEVQLSWIDRYSTCLPNSHNITSGITVGSAISEASCLTLIGEETAGSQRIDWDNGQYSIMSWSSDDVIITTTLSTQTYTVNATVTEGLFLGSRVIEEIILTTPNLLQCLIEPGVTETGGPLVLMIQSAL